MRYKGFTVHAPLMLGGDVGEAEILGAAVWLWMHSDMHRDAPLHVLPLVLLPVIKRRQYVLVQEGDRPVCFLSWAWMDESMERRYLNEGVLSLPEAAWCCGDRMWFRDFIAPFGHVPQMFRLLREEIFPHHIARLLWHRGGDKGRRIKTFYGRQVTGDEIRQWKQAYPLPPQ